MAIKTTNHAIIQQQFASMADWLDAALATGTVRGLSIVLLEEVSTADVSVPLVPQHVFFAATGSAPALAGGLLLAMTELGSEMMKPYTQPAPVVAPPPASEEFFQARGAVFPVPPEPAFPPPDAEDMIEEEQPEPEPKVDPEPTKH